MKFFYLLFIVCLLSVDAQRRSVKSELLAENEPPPKTARRGRARFTLSDQPATEEQKSVETPNRRFASRRRPETRTEAAPVRKTYEVEEVVDEVPIETFRKSNRAKVLTETKYEDQNAPPSNTLFQPSTTENLEDAIKSIGSEILETTSSSVPSSPSTSASLEPSPSELFSSEFTKIDNEITKTQLETTTPLTSKATRRSNGRSRNYVATTPTSTGGSRVRTRTRANRKPEEANSTPTSLPSSRTAVRGVRRRPETNNIEPRARRPQTIASAETVDAPSRSRTRAPPVIASAETVEVPVRSRSGRKIPAANGRRSEETKVTEKSTVDVPQARRTNSRKGVETTTTRSEIRSRSRSRIRDVPPVIDEQKLEVLPLFERESKTVKPVRRVVARRRNYNSAEEVETSATENDVKVAPKPPRQSVVVETRTESNIRRRKVVKAVTGKPTVQTTKQTKPTTKTTTSTTTTTTTSTTAKPTKASTKPTKASTKPTIKTNKRSSVTTKPTAKSSKPFTKESVISEISEVTSKRTVTRSKASSKNKVEIPRFVSRGGKKSEVNLTAVKKNKSGLTSSEEEIDETDNYPEPFKALIQAKKQKKESRPQHRLSTASPIVTKTTEKVVNSSPSTTTQIISSTEAIRQLEDSENELDPIKSVRPTRRRFSQTTEKVTRPTRKTKVARSTSVAPLPTREHRFHAKFNTEPEVTSSSPAKSAKGFSPKPARGLYSSRKSKESFAKTKSAPIAQIPTPKKSNRYSSRYRNDASSRAGIRTSTNAPAYLPTIPTITPPTTSEYVWPEEENIEYSWSFSRLN